MYILSNYNMFSAIYYAYTESMFEYSITSYTAVKISVHGTAYIYSSNKWVSNFVTCKAQRLASRDKKGERPQQLFKDDPKGQAVTANAKG